MAHELATLRARIAKLESGHVVAADLVGRYTVQMFGVETGANPYIATEAGCELRRSRSPSVICTPDAEPPGTFPWRFDNGNFVFTDEDGDHALPVGAGGRRIIFSETALYDNQSWPACIVWSLNIKIAP